MAKSEFDRRRRVDIKYFAEWVERRYVRILEFGNKLARVSWIQRR
jgi:hypothetical protein